MRPPAMTAGEIEDLLLREFPQAFYAGCGLHLERVEYGQIRVRREFHEDHLRPGGTVSGPTIMELADCAMYVAVFSAIGPQPLAVTTTLRINFLRKPAAADLLAETKLLKAGKRLIVGEVTLFSDGIADPVAHVTATYSVPDKAN